MAVVDRGIYVRSVLGVEMTGVGRDCGGAGGGGGGAAAALETSRAR